MAVVVVQRGHVPRTVGKTGAPGEQAFAIASAARVVAHVGALGHEVRVIDADPESNTAYRGDMFVAIHYNGSLNPSVRGASVGHRTAEGDSFAQAWKRHYAAHGWTGGFEGDNNTDALAGYYGVKRAVEQGNRRAFIIEAGFHSHSGDAALLAAPGGPERIGLSVAAAIAEVLGSTVPSRHIPTVRPLLEEDDMFLFSNSEAPRPIFFVAGGKAVGLNEATDLERLSQDVSAAGIPLPHLVLDDDTYNEFVAVYRGG